MKIHHCPICGNQILFLKEPHVIPICCGKTMLILKENSQEASVEKHLPKIIQVGNRIVVSVGEIDHPMLVEHHIEYVILETSLGLCKKDLHPGNSPRHEFLLVDGEKVIAAYTYCNLHGLWKKVI